MNTQIRVYHNKEVAMEVRMSPIYMDKFLFKFWEYDGKAAQGPKESHVIDCFLNVEEVGILINMIKTGKMNKILSKEFYSRTNPTTNRSELVRDISVYKNGANTTEQVDFAFRSTGGSTPAQLTNKKQARTDGAAESRNFKIKPSTKAGNVLLYAEKGKGQVKTDGFGKGFITMVKREKYIQVSITEEQLYELATAMERSLQAIENVKMMYFVEESGLQSILNQEDKESRNYIVNSVKNKSEHRIPTMSDVLKQNQEHINYLEKLVIKLGKNVNGLTELLNKQAQQISNVTSESTNHSQQTIIPNGFETRQTDDDLPFK